MKLKIQASGEAKGVQLRFNNGHIFNISLRDYIAAKPDYQAFVSDQTGMRIDSEAVELLDEALYRLMEQS